MAYRVFGRVIVVESGRPVPNLMVSVFDYDRRRVDLLANLLVRDGGVLTHLPEPSEENQFGDVLGTVLTDEDGRFELRFGVEDFQDEQSEDERPDLLVGVFAPLTSQNGGISPRPLVERLLHFSTFPWIGAGREEGFVIRLRQEQLAEHDISLSDEPPPPTSKPRPLRELLTEAVSKRDERHEAIREAAAETIAPKAVAALERREQAKRVASAFTAVDSDKRQDQFMILDTGTAAERKALTKRSKEQAIAEGLGALEDREAKPITINIRSAAAGIVARTLKLSELCGLMHEATGDYALRRIRTLEHAAARLRRLVVRSFRFSPPVRFDANPWHQVRVEYEDGASAWLPVETLELTGGSVVPSGLDTDPSEPRERSITTELAPVTAARFRVVWIDEDGDESAPSEAMHIQDPHEAATSTRGDHDGEIPGDDGEEAATVSERIQALVEAQVADVVMSAPPGEELPRLPLQRLRAELAAAELASGPAETTAYHDFHTIQLAYPEIWLEALDQNLKEDVRRAYEAAWELAEHAALDPEEFLPDEVLMGEIDDLQEFIDHLAGLEDAISGGRRGSIPAEVDHLWREAGLWWHLLEDFEWTRLSEIATAPFIWVEPSGTRGGPAKETEVPAIEVYEGSWGLGGEHGPHWRDPLQPTLHVSLFDGAQPLIDGRTAMGRSEVLDHVAANYEARIERKGERSSDAGGGSDTTPTYEGPIARLHRLLYEMARMLGEKYSFEYYAADSTNLGLITTYRQTWKPGSYQVGDMVSTIPLAPGESRRLQVKESRKLSRATKETERAMWSRSGESARTSRASTEIVRSAEVSTNFTMTANGSFNIGVGSIGGSSTFSRNQSTHSQATKKDFREAVIKASHEFRNERSLEVSTSEEDLIETTTTGELSNPNNELTVTYLLYELERQYEVFERIHALQPVILVAQKMPRPDEITAAWLLRHEWILRRVLLDDSLIGALDELHNTFAGEEVAIGIQRANWEAQVRIVETLEGEHSHWLNVKRKLNQDLIDAQYRERIAEAAENAGGLFADIGAALVADPLGAAEDVSEARRKMLEDQLKWAHDELQRSAEKLATAREQLDSATRAYSEALESRTQHRTLLDQLRIHVKDNILYYMQAIWSHEPTDQRYFRLHNVVVEWFPQGTATCRVRPAEPDEKKHDLPGVPGGSVVIEDCTPPRWDPDATDNERRLREVADLDRPLGFKGNYMIFPLKTCSLVTDYMMREYIDSYFGIRDPDSLSEFTTEELMEYREHLDQDEKAALDEILTARLSSPNREGETVVVPTGQLYMEALVGTHTLLEPFKLAHRGYDAAKAREELRKSGLENLRYAARMVGDDPQLDDPEVERRIKVSGGDDNVGVDVQG